MRFQGKPCPWAHPRKRVQDSAGTREAQRKPCILPHSILRLLLEHSQEGRSSRRPGQCWNGPGDLSLLRIEWVPRLVLKCSPHRRTKSPKGLWQIRAVSLCKSASLSPTSIAVNHFSFFSESELFSLVDCELQFAFFQIVWGKFPLAARTDPRFVLLIHWLFTVGTRISGHAFTAFFVNVGFHFVTLNNVNTLYLYKAIAVHIGTFTQPSPRTRTTTASDHHRLRPQPEPKPQLNLATSSGF